MMLENRTINTIESRMGRLDRTLLRTLGSWYACRRLRLVRIVCGSWKIVSTHKERFERKFDVERMGIELAATVIELGDDDEAELMKSTIVQLGIDVMVDEEMAGMHSDGREGDSDDGEAIG